MSERLSDEIELLLHYLQLARDALLWKLEGLSEYDARRPMTPTGTNLLGLVKHVASVEYGYLTECFGRDAGISTPWLADDAPDNADMWATADESREFIVSLYREVWAADDAVVRELGLDATGTVPWWGAVSYTHLDVYKRQPMILAMASRLGCARPTPSTSCLPLSTRISRGCGSGSSGR